VARRPLPASVKAWAPCRIDCGGTLDIGPLALGLQAQAPATFNIALDLLTEVEVRPNPAGGLGVESTDLGLEEVRDGAGYSGPLGFFFLALDYFGLKDMSLTVRSASPPRSALGGSSAAILAAVAALARMAGRKLSRLEAVRLAFLIESALFETPCGRQDHLAAAYGGVHLWTWTPGLGRGHKGRQLLKGSAYRTVESRLLVAYPGQSHSSAQVNRTWTQGFVAGHSRKTWESINRATRDLAKAVERADWAAAARAINAETSLRLELTPEVLPPTGLRLFEAARELGVGARFAGAGAGGCLWALGPKARVERLKPIWQEILGPIPQARLLPSRIDRRGLRVVAKGANRR